MHIIHIAIIRILRKDKSRIKVKYIKPLNNTLCVLKILRFIRLVSVNMFKSNKYQAIGKKIY